MSSIRRYVYAALLAITTLSFAPTLVSAQSPARGKFTLPHEVHWQSAVVPAGEYEFKYDPNDRAGVLTLSRMSGARVSFMVLVYDTDEARTNDLNRIVLESRPAGSYVSEMQLPLFGMTLRFAVPAAAGEKQMAKATTETLASDR